LLRRESADGAQRERDLRFLRQRGVTACEDESQTIVFDAALILEGGGRRWVRTRERNRDRAQRDRASIAPSAIDRAVTARADEPRPWVCWNRVASPRLDRDREGLLHRLLGAVEVAEEADERREDSPGVLAVHSVDLPLNVLVAHAGMDRIGRTSME